MPAGTGAIRAGRAFVELFADDSKLVRGLKRASAKLQAFGASVRNMGLKLAGLGAAVATPLLASTKVFAKMGDDLAKMAARTGFSVETLSELGFAADLGGASMEDLEKSIRRMQASIVDAAQGLSTATDALAALGLKVDDLKGLSPEQQFKLMADRLAKIEDPTLKAATAMELFGRSGTQLLPMLAGGAAGLEQIQQQARKLGLTISTEDAKAAEKFTDTLSIMWKVLKQGVFIIGSALAPIVQDLAQRFSGIAGAAADWLRANKELVVTVLKVAAAVVAGGVAMVVLGYAITGLGKAFSILSTVVTGTGVILKFLGAVLAWLVSPIGLVIVAIAALGGYLLYATGAGGKALSWLGEKFGTLKDEAVAAYGGISDALAAGDIGLAAKVLWTTLKMWWHKGTGWLLEYWYAFKYKMVEWATSGFYGILAIWTKVAAFFTRIWAEAVAGLKQTWNNFGGFFSMVGRKMTGWLERRIHDVKGLLDSEYDAEAAKQISQQSEQTDVNNILGEVARKNAEIERGKNARLQEVNQAEQTELADIANRHANAQRRVNKEHQSKLAKLAQEEIDAKKEWQDAIDQARKKRADKEAQDAGPGKMEGPGELLAKLRGKMAGLGDVVEGVKKTINVAGTFNVSSVLGLQAGNADDRIANATERAAKGIEGLRQDVKNNRAAFA